MSTALAVAALVFGILGLLAGWLALRTLAALRRSVGVLGRGAGGRRESFVESVARHIELTERTQQQFDQLSRQVLDALGRYEADAQEQAAAAQGGFAADLATARSEHASRVDAVRAEVSDELTRLREIVNAELGQIRTGIETQRDTALAGVAAERARLAADNTAAKNQVRGAVERVEQVIDGALRRVALVRFDAFDDLAGRLSFSLALLDGRGDGVTLTSLAGRTETRLYAKPINAGQAAIELSPEEHQALEAALRV